MWNYTTRPCARKGLLALAIWHGLLSQAAVAQIYLSPNQQFPQGSRVSIDLGTVRCTSDTGSVPNLSLSAGAYPDQWGNNINVDRSSGTTIGSQSSLLAMLSINVPLARSNKAFGCDGLLKDAMIRTRMDNLRQLVDEGVITESQYKQALIRIFGSLVPADLSLPRSPQEGAVVTIK
jgi:hypothetical protein